MMSMVVRSALERYGRLNKPVSDVRDHDDLHAAGFDSMAMVNVMLALEAECDVEFPEELMIRQSFSSIAALDHVIQQLTTPATHPKDVNNAFART